MKFSLKKGIRESVCCGTSAISFNFEPNRIGGLRAWVEGFLSLPKRIVVLGVFWVRVDSANGFSSLRKRTFYVYPLPGLLLLR